MLRFWARVSWAYWVCEARAGLGLYTNNPTDMSNLEAFFKEWREAVESEDSASSKPPLLLSAAVYFASSFFLDLPRTYPTDAIARCLDFVNPMCFDYHGSWDTSVTGEHALLYDKTSNISTSYGIPSWIEAGVPPKKLVMGIPFYGKSWELKHPKNHGIGAPANGVGPGNNGIMLYSDIVKYNDEHYAHVVYDGDTVSEYSYSGTDWIGYDGTVEKKVEYAKTQNLGGYFFWALGYDMNWTLSGIASNTWERMH